MTHRATSYRRTRSVCAPGPSRKSSTTSNDNPFNAEELAALVAQRRQKYPFGDIPLIVLTRGLSDTHTPEEEHKKKQAALASLSSAGKQVVATRSGHHIPLDEPDIVVTAIREVMTAAAR